MDFKPSPTQLRIQGLARTFAREQVAPFAKEWEERGEIPEDFLLQMARQGFAAMTAPPEFGGSGLDLLSFALALMEMSEVSPSLAEVISANTQACQALATFGTPSQKKRYLPEHVAGGAIGSVALLEPEAGQDLSAIETTAVPVEGGYLLRGRKGSVTAADLRGVAIVSARLLPSKEGPPGSGLTLFIVDKRKEGVRVAKAQRGLGLRACGLAALELEDCLVPEGDRLGEEGGGLEAALTLLDFGRVAAAASAVGLARASLEAAREHAKGVTEGGLPLSEHQPVQFLLADMATSLDAAALLTLRAAVGPLGGPSAQGGAAMAELFAVETAGRVADSALQIFGALGDEEGSQMAWRFADARWMRLHRRTPEPQRSLIARGLLGELE